jgi:hypothetical protein
MAAIKVYITSIKSIVTRTTPSSELLLMVLRSCVIRIREVETGLSSDMSIFTPRGVINLRRGGKKERKNMGQERKMRIKIIPCQRITFFILKYWTSYSSSVGIAPGYWLDDGALGFDSRRNLGIFLFTTVSRPALGPTQRPIQWVPGALTLGTKRPSREADHSPPSNAKVEECVELYRHSPIRLHGVVLSQAQGLYLLST